MMLAQAYALTKNTKYVYEYENQIMDGIEHNVYGFGVNWNCPMEVAIRAANWLAIKELFETSYAFSDEFLIRFYGSIYDHGKYLSRHLRCGAGAKTNHYVSELAGLLIISLYCRRDYPRMPYSVRREIKGNRFNEHR